MWWDKYNNVFVIKVTLSHLFVFTCGYYIGKRVGKQMKAEWCKTNMHSNNNLELK